MEFGQYQMQIALSLIVILGAALVALICDLLKGNNEQLRELAIELKVRREEENKRFQMLAPHAVAAAAGAGAGASTGNTIAAATAPAAMERAAMDRVERNTQQIEEPASVGRPLAASFSKRPERAKRPISPEALAAIQRGEQLAASPRPRRVPDRAPAAEEVSVPQREPETTVPVMEILEAVPAPPAAVATKSSGVSRDWGALLNARPEPGKSTRPVEVARKAPVVIATTSAAPLPSVNPRTESGLPAGFQDGYVLTRLVESRQPVSGLVVSIGASTAPDTNRSLPANVRALIHSLIGPNDFAAQSGKDEFLLIYPGERGASAQRRLSLIAEQLWDFQLRSMGALTILFSWGGVEVRSETIDEAIASATERMQETRRNRRVLTMEPRSGAEAPLRRAV
jgi:hypothetical protein